MRSIFFLLFLSIVFSLSGQTGIAMTDDFDVLAGGRWTGKLTYLDYSSNETTTIRTTLKVEPVKPGKPVWRFYHVYPDEPQANHTNKVRIASNGRRINNETVISRVRIADGSIELVTTRSIGKMRFRYTYRIAEDVYSVRKEEATKEAPYTYIERNTYYYEKEWPVTK